MRNYCLLLLIYLKESVVAALIASNNLIKMIKSLVIQVVDLNYKAFLNFSYCLIVIT